MSECTTLIRCTSAGQCRVSSPVDSPRDWPCQCCEVCQRDCAAERAEVAEMRAQREAKEADDE